MRKSVAAVLVTAATVAGMGFAVTPANAAGSCSSGNICLFENNDYNQGNTNHWRLQVHHLACVVREISTLTSHAANANP